MGCLPSGAACRAAAALQESSRISSSWICWLMCSLIAYTRRSLWRARNRKLFRGSILPVNSCLPFSIFMVIFKEWEGWRNTELQL